MSSKGDNGNMKKLLLIAAVCLVLSACSSAESHKVTAAQQQDNFGFEVQDNGERLNMPNPAARQAGYSVPGEPLSLPAKKIKIYIAPMVSPMGRLIGEHYVWATIQEETWWTPSTSGLDVVVPSEVYQKDGSSK